ncbi:MAG: glycosyltransferase, partial [Halobacteriaceae archaeon]
TSYVLPILAARITGKTVVLEPRGNVPLTLYLTWRKSMPDHLARLLSGIVGMLERVCYSLADAIITYTPSMAAELGLDSFDEKLYPHGARYVNTDRFSVKSPFEERGDVVGFVGRIDEEKGIQSLAEVAERLSNTITFRFVGDGPLYNWLNSELEEEIQLGRVEMTGWVDHEEIPNQLNDLKLLIMASQPTEGLPTIILESMACGVPVMAPGVSGIPDVVRHGETGIIVNNVDPISMVSLIESQLDTENELSDMSVNARELIEESYSFSAAKDRYSSIISSLRS